LADGGALDRPHQHGRRRSDRARGAGELDLAAPRSRQGRMALLRALLGATLTLAQVTTVAAQAGRLFTRADTLRGSFTPPGRAGWDVVFYALHVAGHPGGSRLRGYDSSP